MIRIKSLGLAVASMLALAAFMGTASASAFTVWQVDGTSVTGSVATTSTFTLDLTYSGAGGTFIVRCTGTGTGTVNTGGADTVNTITTTSCLTIQGICGSPRATAANLIWATQLSGSRDNITAGSSGRSPGWTVTCSGSAVTCTTPTSAAITNSPPNVLATFDASSLTASCGGLGTLRVAGTVTNSVSGHTLRAA